MNKTSMHKTSMHKTSMHKTSMHKTSMTVSILIAAQILLFGVLSSGGSAAAIKASPSQQDKIKLIENQWGIKPLTVRLTGADHFLDFRYHIINPDKAVDLLKRNQTAYLIHEASGTKMPVPVTKLGPLRGTSVKPKVNKNYAVLFNNVGKKTKKGDKVTIVIGDCRIEHLTVNLESVKMQNKQEKASKKPTVN